MIEHNGKKYYTVTEVLQPFSGYGDIPKHILEQAAERGTQIHAIIDAYLEGLVEIPTEYRSGYIESFMKFLDRNPGIKFIPKPARFFDDEIEISGECDQIAYDPEGNSILIDFKTSLKESKTWCMQGAAYKYLSRVQDHVINKIWFIQLKKDGSEPIIYDYTDQYEHNLEMFLKLVEVYKFFKPLG